MKLGFKLAIAVPGLLFLGFITLNVLFPLDLDKHRDNSQLIKDINGKWLYTKPNKAGRWSYPAKPAELDPTYVKLLLMYEDKRFFQHFGIDIPALARAAFSSLKARKIVSGGSTITMQLARLLEPKKRTVKAKLIEIFRALQLEWQLDKEQILGWYLTKAPYGGNIEGIEAASRIYFDKKPSSLSLAEAALLTALPQAPEKLKPIKNPARAKTARNKVLKLAFRKNLISEPVYRKALKETLPKVIKPLPRHAPHLAQYALFKNKQDQQSTTLDLVLQKNLEAWARNKAGLLKPDATIAALIVRNQGGSIAAYLGSHDMFAVKAQGFNDMVQTIRSPGSTLKPLIYAMGFDLHLLHPASVIEDLPLNFQGYKPTNFNQEHRGSLTAAQALQYSLNTPAVMLLNHLRPAKFVSAIESISGQLKFSDNRASLPLVLGGVGISMAQLVSLYLNIANDGKSFKLKYRPDAQDKPRRLFSQKAMREVSSILRRNFLPAGFLDQQEKIAFKTGTSYGYRDAWTIGFNRDYTLAVWVGKPSGATNPGHTGINTAAPMLFEVFSLLKASNMNARDWHYSPDKYLTQAPVALRKFAKDSVTASEPMRWLAPATDYVVYKKTNCDQVEIDIEITGGKAPFQWYVNNTPISRQQQHWHWLVQQPGAHRLRVIDQNGHTLSRQLWLMRPTECS